MQVNKFRNAIKKELNFPGTLKNREDSFLLLEYHLRDAGLSTDDINNLPAKKAIKIAVLHQIMLDYKIDIFLNKFSKLFEGN